MAIVIPYDRVARGSSTGNEGGTAAAYWPPSLMRDGGFSVFGSAVYEGIANDNNHTWGTVRATRP